MTRKECLDKAAECVLQDRASQYGGPEDNFGRIAKLWSTYTGTVLDGIDVAMMMALLKVARIRNNKSYEDGYIDLAGYAACGAELAGAEKAREDATRRWGEEYKKLRAKAEGDAKAEGWEDLAMADAEEVEKAFGKPDGGRCQNGKDHAIPEFKSGDAVEWNSIGKSWCPAVYEREFGDFGHCVVRLPDGRERIVSKIDLRKAEANHPENPDSSTEVKPRFKHGDKVQFRDEIPSTSEPHWFDGTYVERLSTGGHAVKFGPHGHVIHCSDKDIRPAPKAEGCEELVQDEAEECRDCDGFQDGSIPEGCEGCMKTLEADAPQTPHDLYKRIIDANPATFKARTPTGKELAEMAEEDEKHG